MKKLSVLSGLVLSLLTFYSFALFAQNGDLDVTYGNSGQVNTMIGNNGRPGDGANVLGGWMERRAGRLCK